MAQHDDSVKLSDQRNLLAKLSRKMSEAAAELWAVDVTTPEQRRAGKTVFVQRMGNDPIPLAEKLRPARQLLNELSSDITPQGGSYELVARDVVRAGHDPVKIAPNEAKLLRLLLAKNPLPIEDTHSREPAAPWRGTYKPHRFPKVQRAVNRLNAKIEPALGLEVKASHEDIRIHVRPI